MTAKRPSDPLLDAEVKRAMMRYRKLLPPDMQKVFEEILTTALTEDPTGKALLDKLRPPPLLANSEDVLKEGAAPVGTAKEAASPAGAAPSPGDTTKARKSGGR